MEEIIPRTIDTRRRVFEVMDRDPELWSQSPHYMPTTTETTA